MSAANIFKINLLYPTPPGHTWVQIDLDLEADAFTPADLGRLLEAVQTVTGIEAQDVRVLDVWRWRPVVTLVLPMDAASALMRAHRRGARPWIAALDGLVVDAVQLKVDDARRFSIGGEPLDGWQQLDLKIDAFLKREMPSRQARAGWWEGILRQAERAEQAARLLILGALGALLALPVALLRLLKGYRQDRAVPGIDGDAAGSSWVGRLVQIVELGRALSETGPEPAREAFWPEELQLRAARFQWRLNSRDLPHLMAARSALALVYGVGLYIWMAGLLGFAAQALGGLSAEGIRPRNLDAMRRHWGRFPVDPEHRPLLVGSAMVLCGLFLLVGLPG